jgi:hypothetical protein
MPATPVFDPVADQLRIPVSVDVGPGWLERWRAAVAESAEFALRSLRRSFGGAVDFYDVEPWLRSMSTSNAAPGAGWVFAVLDYLSWPAVASAHDETLIAYAQRRHIDCWRANGPELLEWLAVQQQIPDEWLPHTLIEERLAAQLRQHAAVASVDVRVEMRLTPRGGISWLRDRSSDHWRAVSESTAAGECCPVVAFGKAGPRVLLTFKSANRCCVYDPGAPEPVTELSHAVVDGFFRLKYQPIEPPLTVWQRMLGAIGLRHVAWTVARSWRRFWRARHRSR